MTACSESNSYIQYPHTESNGDHEGRGPMLSPLSYAGITGARRVELLSPESESGALTVMRSAYNIVTEIRTQNGRFVAARFLR